MDTDSNDNYSVQNNALFPYYNPVYTRNAGVHQMRYKIFLMALILLAVVAVCALFQIMGDSVNPKTPWTFTTLLFLRCIQGLAIIVGIIGGMTVWEET